MEADEGERGRVEEGGGSSPGAMFTAHEYIHRRESHECAPTRVEWPPAAASFSTRRYLSSPPPASVYSVAMHGDARRNM